MERMPELEWGELGGITELQQGFLSGIEMIEWGLRSRTGTSSCVSQSFSFPTLSLSRGRILKYRDKYSCHLYPTLFYKV